jgi:UDP-glucose 4-epimerase
VKVLVCGGAGYIGSHVCVALAERGHDFVILDNFCNSSPLVPERIREIIGRPVEVVHGDIRAKDAMASLLKGQAFDAVMHFAALKAVGESCAAPLAYFENNISGTISLLHAMRAAKIDKLVFSSSATVYGSAENMPVREDAPLQSTNPYGRTKLVMEQLIGDICIAHPEFTAAILRYFNPIGAHASGRIGEDPAGAPNNLMPYITQVAVGRRERLQVFGSDYPTRDGTGVRDYIHVVDLADAHVLTLEKMAGGSGSLTLNLGTGRGYSVLELVHAFTEVTGQEIPLEVVDRRPGDVAELWADPALANSLLGWHARLDVRRMCEDAWRWQSSNPRGYR